MSQHVSVWEVMRRRSLKCGGEYYLKEEPKQHYRINRLEDNGGRFLLHREKIAVPEYTILKTPDTTNYYVPIQHDEAPSYKKQRDEQVSVLFFFFSYTFFQHLIVYSFYNLSKIFFQ